MNTVVLVLMLLTAFNFLLKQTFWKVIAVCVIAAICAAFAGLMWPYAIEQSKTQIANWLSNQPLMLDTAVLLSVEVCVQMAYAMLAVHVANDYPVKPRMIVMYRFLRWFPGLLIFPVLFSGLIYLIFAFPGISFQTIAWSYAGFILIAIPSGRYLLLYLLCTGSYPRNCSHRQRKNFGGRCQRNRLASTGRRFGYHSGRWNHRSCLVELSEQKQTEKHEAIKRINYLLNNQQQ